MRHASIPTTFTFLFVCTGNICRSPFAELLTTHLLAERLGDRAQAFQIGSAGTGAVVGAPVASRTRLELEPWGLAGSRAERFAARQLEPDMVDRADVVLTATVEHRTTVLGLRPVALPKAFALLEFARLITTVDAGGLPSDPIQRAHALVRSAPAQRAKHRSGHPHEDSIADPIGRRQRAHHLAAQQITQAVLAIVATIAP